MKRLTILFIALFLINGAVFSQKIAVGQVKTVVIDPGHGGAKPGALGRKYKEKDITLSIALKLGKVISDNFEDVTVIYTRKTDVDISLAERARIANRAKADLFLSIHANSHPKPESKGVESFVMGLSNSKANLEVAKKENADILLEDDYKNNADYNGFDPNSPESYIMFALYQHAYIDKSLNFAKNIQDQYKSKIKTINRGVKQAELFVLYKTTSPSVLTEVGFISNPVEEEYIGSDEGQADIVYCLFNAFAEYKAAEEGTKKITNPKFDIPGFNKDKKKQDNKNNKKTADTPKDTTKTAPDTTVVATTTVKADTLKGITGTSKTTLPKKSDNKQNTAANDKERAIYRIQFLTSDKKLADDAPQFKGITNFIMTKDRLYRYLTGETAANLDEAKVLQKTIQEMGFKDAFIVPFYKGERISFEEARRINTAK
ncbi:MAG: N-acetylmuramoyl-L-alanine amidase [Bacteroidales bacterium]|nr:N-acetylmuramoyl-L-alanine amidase [Bacteroidales bacterium]